MQIERTYKYRLYSSHKNKKLHQQIDVAGMIYNHCIALHRRYYRITGKTLDRNRLQKHIANLKKLPKHSFWTLVGSQAIQDITDRIYRSYNLFFRNLRNGAKASPPKFQKVKKYKSFTLKQSGWKLLDGNAVRIQGTIYRYHKSRDIPSNARIKRVTVKRDSLGDIYLYFSVKETIEVPSRQGDISAGFDFGMKDAFLQGSDGTKYKSPLFFKQSLNDLRKANRDLSRKVKYSNNWYAAKRKVAKIHQKIVNQRRDWFFKLAHELTDKYDLLFFEDLNMKGMHKLWGRKISDLARSEFMQILEWVAKKKGKIVEYVGRYFPSSKLCNCCGFVNKQLTIKDREWACLSCGVIHDRDENAAINIDQEGLRLNDVLNILQSFN